MGNIGDSKNRTGGWWVYVALCGDGTLYTGCTTDLRRRMMQHNGEVRGGAKYTAARRPVVIVAVESMSSRSDAQREEVRIKSMTRKDKQRWCETHLWEQDEEDR